MGTSFLDLLPAVQEPLERLSHYPAIRYLNDTVWIFAVVETVHLLSLAALGGTVLTLNLRIAGVVLGEVPLPAFERAIRPWFRAGLYGLLLTGVAMAVTTARTLLPSSAFLVKMVALVAALLWSVVVLRHARHGRTGGIGIVVAVAATLVWAVALALFAGTTGLGAGAVLVGAFGVALVALVIARGQGPARALAVAATLAWVTVAVAGRWMGFS